MSRRVKHVSAKRNEYVAVHRSRGGGIDKLIGMAIPLIIGIILLVVFWDTVAMILTIAVWIVPIYLIGKLLVK